MHHTLEWLPAEGRPEQPLLLLHGWGGSGAEMAPLAQAHLARRTRCRATCAMSSLR